MRRSTCRYEFFWVTKGYKMVKYCHETSVALLPGNIFVKHCIKAIVHIIHGQLQHHKRSKHLCQATSRMILLITRLAVECYDAFHVSCHLLCFIFWQPKFSWNKRILQNVQLCHTQVCTMYIHVKSHACHIEGT